MSAVTSFAGLGIYSFLMTKGLKRYYGAGTLHFITCGCYHRKPWLDTESRRNLFVSILEKVRWRYRFVVPLVVLGYVVMPEHFHLLISEPHKGDPSKVMQLVKQLYAQRTRCFRLTSAGWRRTIPRL